MKVVDKKLLFIHSSERDSGAINDFKISLPSHLLACEPHQQMRLVLNDLVLPYTWYNVQATNNQFTLVEEDSADPSHYHSITLRIDEGSYSAMELAAKLTWMLTYWSHHHLTYTVTFDPISAKFTYTIDPFEWAETYIGGLTFNTDSAHSLLGFPFDKGASSSTGIFTHLGAGLGNQLVSPKTVSMMFTDALHFHTDVLNTNVDRGTGEGRTFHLSDVFAKVPINTSPFNNIIFQNMNDDYLVNIADRRVSEFHFWFTTDRHNVIALNDDFSFTLKVEVVEDDEKTLVAQNSGLGELLKLMVLQQHQQHKQQQKHKRGDRKSDD